MSPRGLMDKA